MVTIDELGGPEWAEWYRMTPQERWAAQVDLWVTFLTLGGTLEPEPDSQSPFYDPHAQGAVSVDGRPGVRVIRRSRV
jgi:hypothetical protein